eukprot:1513669-Ditylum_brightwellii.AAC.1
MQKATHAVNDALVTAMHATRLIADLVAIWDRCQEIINENLRCQNLKQQEWDYAIGQEVLIKEVDTSKLQPRAHSPYTTVQ